MNSVPSEDKPRLIGELLLDEGLLTHEQISEAIAIQGKFPEKFLGEILIERKFVSPDQLLHYLNAQIARYNDIINAMMGKDRDAIHLTKKLDRAFYLANIQELTSRTKSTLSRVNFTTNVTLIDIQHVWLIMLSHYAQLINKTKETEEKAVEIGEIIDLLISYTREHFIVEERLFELIERDAKHVDEHHQFLTFVAAEKERITGLTLSTISKTSTILGELCEYLNQWILSHVAVHDMNFAIKLARHPKRHEILTTWIEGLKTSKIVTITVDQRDFYSKVTSISIG